MDVERFVVAANLSLSIGFVDENYLPEELEGTQFYFPTENGQEKNIKERLKFLWRNKKEYI